VAQAVFEIQGMLLTANYRLVVSGDKTVLARGRKGVEDVLARLSVRRER
jgi:hypothetical protein